MAAERNFPPRGLVIVGDDFLPGNLRLASKAEANFPKETNCRSGEFLLVIRRERGIG